ncbi:MAG: PTS sugar transporter subunit IIB [Chloroflexi bacterium]|nr:PTS sugar transporter subunit IIB [Chloroflexota bacterium]
MLVEKMEEAAKEKNIEAVINAYPESKLDTCVDDADIVLLAPQVRFKKNAFEEKYKATGVPFVLIDTSDYGMLNGEKVLEEALEELKKKGGK